MYYTRVFMIQVLKNLLEEDDVIFNGLEDHLVATGDDALINESIHEKLNHRYQKKLKKKKHWALIMSNTNSIARNVESMATNHTIGDALKIKMKMMKMIRKQKDLNMKIKSSNEFATIVVRSGIRVRIVEHRQMEIIKN